MLITCMLVVVDSTCSTFPDTQISSMSYTVTCKVYTGCPLQVRQSMVCSPVQLVVCSLKLVDYLSIRADNHALFSTWVMFATTDIQVLVCLNLNTRTVKKGTLLQQTNASIPKHFLFTARFNEGRDGIFEHIPPLHPQKCKLESCLCTLYFMLSFRYHARNGSLAKHLYTITVFKWPHCRPSC